MTEPHKYYYIILSAVVLLQGWCIIYVYSRLCKAHQIIKEIIENLDSLFMMSECYFSDKEDIKITEVSLKELENGTNELRGTLRKK